MPKAGLLALALLTNDHQSPEVLLLERFSRSSTADHFIYMIDVYSICDVFTYICLCAVIGVLL